MQGLQVRPKDWCAAPQHAGTEKLPAIIFMRKASCLNHRRSSLFADKNVLRIGNEYDNGERVMTSWYHVACWPVPRKLQCLTEIQNWDDLTAAQQQEIIARAPGKAPGSSDAIAPASAAAASSTVQHADAAAAPAQGGDGALPPPSPLPPSPLPPPPLPPPADSSASASRDTRPLCKFGTRCCERRARTTERARARTNAQSSLRA